MQDAIVEDVGIRKIAADSYLINEYNSVLKDVETMGRTEWRLLLAFLASTGAGIVALTGLISVEFPAAEAGILILGITYFVTGIFLSLTVYKCRRFAIVDFARLGEIENTAKSILYIPTDTPWGRWGEQSYWRLWNQVKENKGYSWNMIGLVDYGIMFVLGSAGVAWLSVTVWVSLGRWLGYSSDLAAIMAVALFVMEMSLLTLVLDMSLSEKRPYQSTPKKLPDYDGK